MQKILLAAFSKEGTPVKGYLTELGHRVKVLDCFEDYHRKLLRWYGADTLYPLKAIVQM